MELGADLQRKLWWLRLEFGQAVLDEVLRQAKLHAVRRGGKRITLADWDAVVNPKRLDVRLCDLITGLDDLLDHLPRAEAVDALARHERVLLGAVRQRALSVANRLADLERFALTLVDAQ
jgi:hypothetical protein